MIQEQLKKFLKPEKRFGKNDLWNFYAQSEGKKISEEDFFWYVCDLKQERIIKEIGRDIYELVQEKPTFSPKIDIFLKEICKNVAQKLALTTYCIWETNWLNEFTVHQNMRNLVILEVEKEVCESIFYALKDLHYPNVFLLLQQSDHALIERYIFEAENPIIIRKLVSKSPINKKTLSEDVFFPKLEKILVDLFCDEALLIAYKGHEQDTIFKNAFQNYAIRLQTLFSYAQRRKKNKELKNYLYQNFRTEIENSLL